MEERRIMSTERDTPMLYDTAGGTQAVEADTNSHIQMCNYAEANTHACQLAQTPQTTPS